MTMCLEHGRVSLTVCEASDPSKSGDGNMRHIPIHAEGEGGECVDTQVDQGVDGRHPSSHLLTPTRVRLVRGRERQKNSVSDGQERDEREKEGKS